MSPHIDLALEKANRPTIASQDVGGENRDEYAKYVDVLEKAAEAYQAEEVRDTLREYPVGTTGAEPVRREYLEQLLATLDGESGDDEVEEASDESGPEDEEQAQTSDAAA